MTASARPREDRFAALRGSLGTAALLGIVALVIAGVWSVDRALTSTRRTEVLLEAAQIASLLDAFLSRTAGTIAVTRAAPGIIGDSSLPRAFPRVADAVLEEEPAFQALWLADTAGRVVAWRSRGGRSVLAHTDLDDVPTVDLLMARSRASRRTEVGAPTTAFGPDSGIAVVEPMREAGTLVGFVGGLISTRAIREAIERRHHRMPAELRLRAGGVTILERRHGKGSLYRASAAADYPGAREWHVDVGQPAPPSAARIALWAVGALTVLGLLVAAVQERRQAVRLTERSAELERLSAELLRANRAKSEFLANVSHELRTPLTAVVGFVDLLRDGVYGELSPRQSGPVDRIAASATHLRHLVDQVLDIAKMAAGRLEVHTEPVTLRPFVVDVMSDVESLVNERGLAVSIAVSTSLPRIRTDPTHLRQILTNLVGNAIKFTPKGVIAVRARLIAPAAGGETPRVPAGLDPGRTWVAVQVADTGIGIAAADVERIFEEFEQVEPGSRGQSATRGTGLGLPISRRLARLLGGDVTVTSEPGQGSTFTLWLPVHPADVPLPRRGSPTPPTPAEPVRGRG